MAECRRGRWCADGRKRRGLALRAGEAMALVGVTGSAPNVNLSPYDGSIHAGEAYNSVEAGGFAKYIFSGTQYLLSFVWGSPDTYNSIEFYLGGVSVDALNGLGNGQNLANPYATVCSCKIRHSPPEEPACAPPPSATCSTCGRHS